MIPTITFITVLNVIFWKSYITAIIYSRTAAPHLTVVFLNRSQYLYIIIILSKCSFEWRPINQNIWRIFKLSSLHFIWIFFFQVGFIFRCLPRLHCRWYCFLLDYNIFRGELSISKNYVCIYIRWSLFYTFHSMLTLHLMSFKGFH